MQGLEIQIYRKRLNNFFANYFERKINRDNTYSIFSFYVQFNFTISRGNIQ